MKSLHNFSLLWRICLLLLLLLLTEKCIETKPVNTIQNYRQSSQAKQQFQQQQQHEEVQPPTATQQQQPQLQYPAQLLPKSWLNEHGQPRPMIIIKNDVPAQHINDYKIVHQTKEEPCLTISWNTNPDGSGPGYPKIYMVDGQFKLLNVVGNTAK